MPGGQRQRISQAAGGVVATSVLALWLLEQVFRGHISPQFAQKAAELGCTDIQTAGGEPLLHLSQVAGIGAHGRYPNNCHRDLMNLVKEPLLPTENVKVPMKANARPYWTYQNMSFVDPHAAFAAMYQQKDLLCRGQTKLSCALMRI